MINAYTEGYSARVRGSVPLPESLRVEGLRLAIAEVGGAALIVILMSVLGYARDAALALTIALFVSQFLGRYRVSFAVRPRDEAYAVIAAALASAVLLAALLVPFAASPLAAYLALVLWTAGAATTAVRFCATRRNGAEVVSDLGHLTPAQRLRARNPLSRAALRACDIVLSIVGSVVLFPVMIGCALAVARGDKGPIFYSQERTGLDGRPFLIYKFRTMRVGAGEAWATPDDDRITRPGRFLRRTSLDELPQLINVLRGEMSLVGPRPEMVSYANDFVGTVASYEDRLAILPGITGWAQIHYQRNFQPDASPEVLRYDLFYVGNYCLPLYLICLVKTAAEIATHRAV